MATIEKFEDIDAWKMARELAKAIYRITSAGGFSRDFGLRDQMRRASVSIMSNIAEGFERSGNKEFVQFLTIAKGSAGELRAQLYVASDQSYISDEEFKAISQSALKISQIISGFIRYLSQSELRGSKFK